MSPEMLNALSLFEGIELVTIALLFVIVSMIIFLGPKWLDKRNEIKLVEINKENQQVDAETNAMVKEISSRIGRLEESGHDFNTKLENLEVDKVNTKMLARDILKSLVYNESSSMPMLDRLEYARDFLKLGGNGNCRKHIKQLVVANKELWNHVLDEDSKHYTNAEMKEYYLSALEDIKKSVCM